MDDQSPPRRISRRAFLQGGAVTGAGIAIGAAGSIIGRHDGKRKQMDPSIRDDLDRLYARDGVMEVAKEGIAALIVAKYTHDKGNRKAAMAYSNSAAQYIEEKIAEATDPDKARQQIRNDIQKFITRDCQHLEIVDDLLFRLRDHVVNVSDEEQKIFSEITNIEMGNQLGYSAIKIAAGAFEQQFIDTKSIGKF